MGFRDDYVFGIRQLAGVPYVYGGKDESGIDCSGCIVYGMAKAGCPFSKDMTAFEISQFFLSKKINPLQAPPGALFFYGNPVKHVMSVISHFNSGLESVVLLGARGGNRNTTTPDLAALHGAYVATVIASQYWTSNFNFAVDPFQP